MTSESGAGTGTGGPTPRTQDQGQGIRNQSIRLPRGICSEGNRKHPQVEIGNSSHELMEAVLSFDSASDTVLGQFNQLKIFVQV